VDLLGVGEGEGGRIRHECNAKSVELSSGAYISWLRCLPLILSDWRASFRRNRGGSSGSPVWGKGPRSGGCGSKGALTTSPNIFFALHFIVDAQKAPGMP